jgi:hypothetical protein
LRSTCPAASASVLLSKPRRRCGAEPSSPIHRRRQIAEQGVRTPILLSASCRDEGTLAVIRRETGSARWMVMFAPADVASLLTFNLAQAFALS